MSKKTESHIDLPAGWRREEKPVKGGIRGWRSGVVYVSPDNQEVRSLRELQQMLPDFDFSYFDFNSGKSLRSEARKLKQKQREILKDGVSFPKRTISSGSILSKVSQSVTTFGNHEDSEVKMPSTQKTHRRKPRQIFWNKRLVRPKSRNSSGQTSDCTISYHLPDPIKPLLDTPAEVVLSSTVGCLHLTSQQELQIFGQQQNHFKAIHNNPAVWVNYNQPMFEKFVVSDEDIKEQEKKVLQLRTKLLQLQE